jgi:DNA invertase Pin-like site-specific DNA recombinase
LTLPHISPGWATYLRVSDEDKQTPERSFAMQRQRIQEQLLSSSSAPLYREYTDLLSGTNPNRKDYRQLLADAEAGKFSHIGLYRADRFGRNTVEGLQAATKLISLGVKIRIANMPGLQPENPDGFFMFLLQMGLAQREVDVLAQRTADGMEAKLRAGGWAHKAPDGYLNKERLVSSNKYERWVEIDPSYKPVLKDAWDLLLTGRYTLREICEELTASGYTRVSGRPWAWNDPKTGKRKTAFNLLHKLFHNPFYAGWVTSERFGIKIGEVRGNWEPIVSTEQFHRGVQILHKKDNEKSRLKKHVYLLRGLLWVKAGGNTLKMYGSTPTGKYRSYSYYITHANIDGKKLHIPCDAIDEQIPAWLKGISVDPDLVSAIRDVYQKEIEELSSQDRQGRLSELKRQVTLLKEEETRLGRLYITGKLTEDAYGQLHSEWQEKLRVNELNLAELEREATVHLNDLDLALALMTKMADLYPRLDVKGKATLVQILVKRLIVDGEGEIIDHDLNSPFVYLRSLVDVVCDLGDREVSNLGRSYMKKSSKDVEGFLVGLRFEQNGKLEELPINLYPNRLSMKNRV